jgi:transcriptional regulator with XRE-family HTH domain
MRQQRERQQITLETIADRTKIKLSLLEALERDDVTRWPLGIFRRAFMRSYAQHIGLDPDAVVREFLELYPDPSEEAVAVVAATAEDRKPTAGPPTRLRYVVGTAMSFLTKRLADAPAAAPSADSTPMAPAPIEEPALFGLEPLTPPLDILDAEPVADMALPEPAADLDTAVTIGAAETTFAADVTIVSAAPDLEEAARLCSEIARVEEPQQAAPFLEQAARLLNAVGVIMWEWVPQASELRPALACGYSEQVLAQLPKVRRDTDNATAAAFRSGQTCSVKGTDAERGAVVVPMMTAAGCVGVLAAELPQGQERHGSVRALMTILAAQLARLVGAAHPEAARKLA